MNCIFIADVFSNKQLTENVVKNSRDICTWSVDICSFLYQFKWRHKYDADNFPLNKLNLECEAYWASYGRQQTHDLVNNHMQRVLIGTTAKYFNQT